MRVSDFDYELPPHLIAQEPVPRGASRLMVIDRRSGAVAHHGVGDLPSLLAPGDLLVVNDTRVFPARLLGRRVPTGAAVECMLIGRIGPAAPSAAEGVLYEALMHPGQKLRPGARVVFERSGAALHGEVLERRFFGRRVIRLWSDAADSVDRLIEQLGHVPLPPYIKRADTPADRERYQTVYARERGSVAAPTAGLHFSDDLLLALDARGIDRVSITLHVGYGTFKPVRVETVEEHTVDPEHYSISPDATQTIGAALARGRRIVAVGTTTTRALEDAALRGNGTIRAGDAAADLFIYPGFSFRVVGALMTNFHLPRSSLLMLVSAFAGRKPVMAAYKVAMEQGYRFYSYGDAMLIL